MTVRRFAVVALALACAPKATPKVRDIGELEDGHVSVTGADDPLEDRIRVSTFRPGDASFIGFSPQLHLTGSVDKATGTVGMRVYVRVPLPSIADFDRARSVVGGEPVTLEAYTVDTDPVCGVYGCTWWINVSIPVPFDVLKGWSADGGAVIRLASQRSDLTKDILLEGTEIADFARGLREALSAVDSELDDE